MRRTSLFAVTAGIFSLVLGGVAGLDPVAAAEPSIEELSRQAVDGDDLDAREAAIDTLAARGSRAAAAVPELIELLDDPQSAIRAHAARALGFIGASEKQRILQSLATRVGDQDPHVRRAAIRAWARLRPTVEQGMPLMSRLLQEADPATRAQVLDAVAELGAVAVPRLIEVLDTEQGRYWSILVLGEIGPAAAPATEPLAKVLQQDDRPEVKREAALALASIGSQAKAAVPTLVEVLDSDAPGVREAAVFALGRIGKPSAPAVEKIRQFADQEQEPLQTVSLWALARIMPDDEELVRRVVPLLVEEIVDDDPATRAAAARALGDLKPDPTLVLTEMRRVLDPADPEQLDRAMDAIATLEADAVPALIKALQNEQVDERVAQVIARIGPEAEAAVPALSEVLGRDDADARSEALLALAAIGPAAKPAVPKMIDALDDPDMNVRYAAAFALGNVGPAALAAKPALQDKLDGADDFLAKVAAWALAHIHPQCKETAPSSVPLLIDALDSPSPRVRVRAIEALGCLGPLAKDAVEPLEGLQQSEDPAVRQAASDAIRAIRAIRE